VRTSGPSGNYGGNMDYKMSGVGSVNRTLSSPVSVADARRRAKPKQQSRWA